MVAAANTPDKAGGQKVTIFLKFNWFSYIIHFQFPIYFIMICFKFCSKQPQNLSLNSIFKKRIIPSDGEKMQILVKGDNTQLILYLKVTMTHSHHNNLTFISLPIGLTEAYWC
jgi:hypothetical protein